MMTLFQIFGPISTTPGLDKYPAVDQGGLTGLLSVILKLLVMIASIWTLLQLIFAGYGFMSAGGDPKSIESAWSKVWQSLVGLTIVAGSFVLAAIFGYIIFGDPNAILSPKIYTP
jgi:hypothetical protein